MINLFKKTGYTTIEFNPAWMGETGYPDMLNSDNTDWEEGTLYSFQVPGSVEGIGFMLGGKPQVLFERKTGVLIGCFNKSTMGQYLLPNGPLNHNEVHCIRCLLEDSSVIGISNTIRDRCMGELDITYRSAYTSIKHSTGTLEEVQLIVTPPSGDVIIADDVIVWGNLHMPDPQAWLDALQSELNEEARIFQCIFIESLQA